MAGALRLSHFALSAEIYGTRTGPFWDPERKFLKFQKIQARRGFSEALRLIFSQVQLEPESHMEKQFKHISHKFIDSLSDGVFSIALTLLGLNVVELVPEISQSENFNSAILENWPTLFSYLLGFVVLFSTWYQYHVTGQYTDGTNAWIVWQHGLAMAWVALMPFGVALLAQNLDTPNRKWGVFYFGVCLFGNYWTTMILAAFTKFNWPVNWTEDLPTSPELFRKAAPIFMGVTAIFGVLLVSLSLVYPWAALVGYGLFVSSNISPVSSLNRMKPYLEKIAKSKSGL